MIRYVPAEPGKITSYRLTAGSVLRVFPGKQGFEMTATPGPANHPGWLRNPRICTTSRWWTALFYTCRTFTWALSVPGFRSDGYLRDGRHWSMSARRSTSIILPSRWSISLPPPAFRTPEFFRAAEEKITYANQHGIMDRSRAFFGP